MCITESQHKILTFRDNPSTQILAVSKDTRKYIQYKNKRAERRGPSHIQ